MTAYENRCGRQHEDLGDRRTAEHMCIACGGPEGQFTYQPLQFCLAGRYLFFTAIDPSSTNGRELWAVPIQGLSAVRNWHLYDQ